MKYTAKTPFDTFIARIHYEIWTNHRSNPNLTFCAEQLRLLKVCYLMMLEFDFFLLTQKHFENQANSKKKVFLAKTSEKVHLKGITSYLGYYFFINSVKIFADCLDKMGLIKKQDFPNYEVITIFRNKVSQHWNDYTKAMGAGRLSQKYGKVPVPLIYESAIPKDKFKKLQKTLLQIFKNYGCPINSDIFTSKPYQGLHLARQSYHKIINQNLIFITHKTQGSIPPTLTKILFEVGFPLPVLDIQDYAIKITKLLEKTLKRQKLLSNNKGYKKKIWHYSFFGKLKPHNIKSGNMP